VRSGCSQPGRMYKLGERQGNQPFRHELHEFHEFLSPVFVSIREIRGSLATPPRCYMCPSQPQRRGRPTYPSLDSTTIVAGWANWRPEPERPSGQGQRAKEQRKQASWRCQAAHSIQGRGACEGCSMRSTQADWARPTKADRDGAPPVQPNLDRATPEMRGPGARRAPARGVGVRGHPHKCAAVEEGRPCTGLGLAGGGLAGVTGDLSTLAYACLCRQAGVTELSAAMQEFPPACTFPGSECLTGPTICATIPQESSSRRGRLWRNRSP
jgi:hypothetical protein